MAAMMHAEGRFLELAVILALCGGAAPLAAGESPGCSAPPVADGTLAAARPGVSIDLELPHDGLVREYRLHLPAGHDGSTPMPLWLHVHGYTGSATGSDGWTGLSALADREGFAVAYPQGTSFTPSADELPGNRSTAAITSWNDLACSAPLRPEAPACREDASPYPCPPECADCGRCNWCSCHDDVGYIGALIDHLSEGLCLDQDRVFASGYSNGGMFVHRLGCALDDRLAAVAPMHGYLARGFRCAPEAAGPSMLLIGGTEDRTVPIDGSFADDGYVYASQQDVAEQWAEALSCAAEPVAVETPWDGRLELTCVEYSGCTGERTVRSCSWQGAHVWPRDGDDASGGNFGAELMWSVFREATRDR